MPLQRPKCYILLEWACCLLVAIAISSVIRNHRFVRWICSSLLKRTLKISLLNNYLRGGASGICLAYESLVVTKMEILKNTLKCITRHRIRQCLHESITGFINGFIKRKGIQATYSDYLEKDWNISTFPRLSKFWVNPFTNFHLAHVKFQTHAKDLLSHTKFVESHTTHSGRTALRAGLFVHFEIHVKNDGIIQSSTMNLIIFFSNFFDSPATHPALNH